MHRGTIGRSTFRLSPAILVVPFQRFPVEFGATIGVRPRARARARGHVRMTAAKGGEVDVGQLCESRAR